MHEAIPNKASPDFRAHWLMPKGPAGVSVPSTGNQGSFYALVDQQASAAR
jgi:hypothetical protein